jgi:hypothetical protein
MKLLPDNPNERKWIGIGGLVLLVVLLMRCAPSVADAAAAACQDAVQAKAKALSLDSWSQRLTFTSKSDGTLVKVELIGKASFPLDISVNGTRQRVPVEVRCLFDPPTKKACVFTPAEAPAEVCDHDELRNWP